MTSLAARKFRTDALRGGIPQSNSVVIRLNEESYICVVKVKTVRVGPVSKDRRRCNRSQRLPHNAAAYADLSTSS